MAGGSLKPMPDLYPITEGIIPIDRVSALFVPGNFRGIGSPVVFFSIEPFKNGRVQFGSDPKIDVRPLDRARASLSDLIQRGLSVAEAVETVPARSENRCAVP